MAPTLVASYPVYANASTTATLTTPSFTPANGEVLVVKLTTYTTTISMSAPTGGSQTFTSALIVAPGGFTTWVGVYFATVSGSPVAMTVSSTPSASSWHSMVVERWSGAQVAATPAVNSTVTGGGGTGNAPTATVTTTAAGSIVTWVDGDAQSASPTGHTYNTTSGTVTEDGFQDGSIGSNSVTYHAYQTAVTAGAQTIGMTAPNTQKWVMAGMEVLASGGGATPVSGSDTGSGADTATLTASLAATDTGTGTEGRSLAVATSATDAGSGTDTATAFVTVSVSDTATGADAATLAVLVTATELGSGADATPARSLTAAEVATGIDATALAVSLTGSDTGTAADAGQASVGAISVNAADTVTGTDAATVVATLTAADTASGVDAIPVRAFTASDTMQAVDAATVNNGLSTDITVNAGQPRRGWSASAPVSGWSPSPPARRWSAGKPTI